MDYRELIDYLNTQDAAERRRKEHRLPMDRYAQSDCEYFLTLCARHQGTPFTRPAVAQPIVDALLWRRQKHGWILRCYCLMPDHLHCLIRLPEQERDRINAGARGVVTEGILEQIGQFKSFTTSQVWWKQGGQGPLWQRSSYDRVIWYDRSAEAAAHYVVNNPVRKGLAAAWEDYPYARIIDGW